MKIRIKFSKYGNARFIGHLDTMRFFQKAVRRCALPAAFSAGYSPHMIMSFAAPLGVGMEGMGEYFDLELTGDVPEDEIVRRLNTQMAEGFHVEGAVKVPDGKSSNAMSLVAAADYRITCCETAWQSADLPALIRDYLSQDEILITKTGKSGERQVDIRPYIYRMESVVFEGKTSLFLRLASASSNYTRPDQVLDTFCAFSGLSLPRWSAGTTRLELYAQTRDTDTPPLFVPLDRL